MTETDRLVSHRSQMILDRLKNDRLTNRPIEPLEEEIIEEDIEE